MVAFMISRRSGPSLYQQVAAAIRKKITDGDLVAGDQLKSEKYMAEEYKVGRDTIRDALQHLRNEGLIDTRRGYRSRVRTPIERELVWLRSGEKVFGRMPTPEEREQLDMSEGVPVLVVADHVYPADRFELRAE
jgi:DNA-binding GntR family transcriptional regulator